MKNAQTNLLLGIALGFAAAYVLLKHNAPTTPAPGPIRPELPGNQAAPLPPQIGGRWRYRPGGRPMIAGNYLTQPGYPMPGWQV